MKGINTGTLKYKNQDFTFVFDGNELELIPKDLSIASSWIFKDLGNGLKTFNSSLQIEESVIVGKCYETRTNIIFIFNVGSNIDFVNETFYVKPRAYVKCKYNSKAFNRLSFTCPELDLIYPVGRAYQIKFGNTNENERYYSIETNTSYKNTKEVEFIFENKPIKVCFSISNILKMEHRAPLEYVSLLNFSFKETDDYLFAYKLCIIARKFIQFLCNRKNISFDSIFISSPYQDWNFVKYAEMVEIQNKGIEETNAKSYVIGYHLIEGHETMILQLISDNSLYLRHLPETYRLGKTVTAATFVMTTAAFEWEFRKLHPEGIPKKEKVQQAEDNVKSTLNQLIEAHSGKERNILKFLVRNVGNDYLAGEIIHVGKELKSIIEPIGQYIYRINDQELKFSEMGGRIATQRNNFAHGNLDKDFIGLALTDIVFLKKIVYAMQLKRIGLDDYKICNAINELFHLNIYFEDVEVQSN